MGKRERKIVVAVLDNFLRLTMLSGCLRTLISRQKTDDDSDCFSP